MKNFLKISLIAVLFLTATGVKANDVDFTLKVRGEKEKFIRFSFDQNENVNLSFSTYDNEVLFQEKIQAKAASSKVYDLNSLPDGKYFLRIESEEKLAKYEVSIVNGKTIVSEPTISEVFHPVVKKVGDVVLVTLQNNESAPIDVEVLNEYNDSIYSETIKDTAQLQKKFNISRSDSQSLTFVVKVKDQKYTKTIELY